MRSLKKFNGNARWHAGARRRAAERQHARYPASTTDGAFHVRPAECGPRGFVPGHSAVRDDRRPRCLGLARAHFARERSSSRTPVPLSGLHPNRANRAPRDTLDTRKYTPCGDKLPVPARPSLQRRRPMRNSMRPALGDLSELRVTGRRPIVRVRWMDSSTIPGGSIENCIPGTRQDSPAAGRRRDPGAA